MNLTVVFESPMKLIESAEQAERERRWEDAATDWRAVLQQRPSDVTSAIGLGRCLLQLSHFDEAEITYGRIRRIDPNNLYAHVGLINVAKATNRKLVELSLFLEGIKRFPGASKAVVDTIELLLQLGRVAEADDLLRERNHSLTSADNFIANLIVLKYRNRTKEILALVEKNVVNIAAHKRVRGTLLYILMDIGAIRMAVDLWLGTCPSPMQRARGEVILALSDLGIDRDEASQTIRRLWESYGWAVFQLDELPHICRAIAREDGTDAALLFLFNADRIPLEGPKAFQAKMLTLFERLSLGIALNPNHELSRIAAQTKLDAAYDGWRASLQHILQCFDIARSKFSACHFDTGYSPRSARAVLERILACYEAREPLSLIRLGDGEGAFLQYPTEFREFTDADRTFMQMLWWKTPALSPEEGIELSHQFVEVVRGADIIGIMTLEHITRSFPPEASQKAFPASQYGRGIFSLLHQITLLGENSPLSCFHANQTMTSLMAFYDFESHGLFEELFEKIDQVSLITCHQDLGEYLRKRFNVTVNHAFIIPGEAKFSEIFQYADTTERHYPHFFNRLKVELDKYGPGTVTLVAAGFLGKFYCHWIKQRGGIALDLGSIVDQWRGFKTRSANWTLQR